VDIASESPVFNVMEIIGILFSAAAKRPGAKLTLPGPDLLTEGNAA
jgi:hypothetical protein